MAATPYIVLLVPTVIYGVSTNKIMIQGPAISMDYHRDFAKAPIISTQYDDLQIANKIVAMLNTAYAQGQLNSL